MKGVGDNFCPGLYLSGNIKSDEYEKAFCHSWIPTYHHRINIGWELFKWNKNDCNHSSFLIWHQWIHTKGRLKQEQMRLGTLNIGKVVSMEDIQS